MNKKFFSAAALKNIAIITMVIDHLGMTIINEAEHSIFPSIGIQGPITTWMRLIGRIAFVLFAFLLSEGFIYTSNRKKYVIRLGIGAVISEIPYDLVETGRPFNIWNQNIFFTLLLGFCVIWILESIRNKNIAIKVLVIILGLIMSELLRCEYGVMGIGLIIAFYCLKGKAILYPIVLVECFVGHLVNDLLSSAIQINRDLFRQGAKIRPLLSWDEITIMTKVNFEERLFHTMPGIIAALLLIFLYNQKKGKQLPKAFYYLFYPLHLIIIFFLMQSIF